MVTTWLISPGYDLIRGSDPPPTLFLDLDSKNGKPHGRFFSYSLFVVLTTHPRPIFFTPFPKCLVPSLYYLPQAPTHTMTTPQPTPQPKRINDAQVQQIRQLYADGQSQSQIAKSFGMRQTNVSKIVRGDTHKNAPGPINKVGRASGERHGLTKLSTEEVAQMRTMRTELGTSYNDLSRVFNLSPTQCRLICMGVARVNG